MKVSMSLDDMLWWEFGIECKKRKTYASHEVSQLIRGRLDQWAGTRDDYTAARDARQLDLFLRTEGEEGL
jgi:hypothetical protein